MAASRERVFAEMVYYNLTINLFHEPMLVNLHIHIGGKNDKMPKMSFLGLYIDLTMLIEVEQPMHVVMSVIVV